jgi:hypothetical protein
VSPPSNGSRSRAHDEFAACRQTCRGCSRKPGAEQRRPRHLAGGGMGPRSGNKPMSNPGTFEREPPRFLLDLTNRRSPEAIRHLGHAEHGRDDKSSGQGAICHELHVRSPRMCPGADATDQHQLNADPAPTPAARHSNRTHQAAAPVHRALAPPQNAGRDRAAGGGSRCGSRAPDPSPADLRNRRIGVSKPGGARDLALGRVWLVTPIG